MSDDRSPMDVLAIALAKLALMEQLMRLLLRERAANSGETPEDIMAWAEELKSFFESYSATVSVQARMTGAIDEYFKVLASEVRRDRGNPG